MLDLHVASHGDNSFPLASLAGPIEHIIWALVVIFALLWIGAPTLRGLFERVHDIDVAGISLSLAEKVETIIEEKGFDLVGGRSTIAANRLVSSKSLLDQARFLWVDDHPDNNRLERRLLKSLGAQVDCAVSTEEALRLDLYFDYDLIISDMARALRPRAGEELAERIAARSNPTPVIIYAGRSELPPPSVFGLTIQPDELFHLILDVLARNKSP